MAPSSHFSLDGAWDFHFQPPAGAVTFAALADVTTWRTAQVPLPWQAQFDDLRLESGVAWYRRSFPLDAAPAADNVVHLHFGAVDYFATVWLNGVELGSHEGGYLPFHFDVTGHVRAGENELVVRVEDANDDRSRFPERPFSEVPHGKQSWYGPIGGIWQSVRLETLPALHMTSLKLTPNIEDNAIAVDVALSLPLPEGCRLEAIAFRMDGTANTLKHLDAAGHGKAELRGVARRWSPDDPYLYRVVVELRQGDTLVHAVEANCGFRTVEARDGRIFLNGQPVYLRGVLDQAYYPETIYTIPSVAFLEDQARKAKALGLNCLRTHIKIEDPRYYDVADRFGLLIWTEIPNWVLLTDKTDERAKATFRQMVERDWNHPSIIIWTLINENWGTDLSRNPDHRQWLRDLYPWAKEVDPTRLIVDNSACHGNSHVTGDLEDYHYYTCIPDHAPAWDSLIAGFANRSDPRIWYADCEQDRRTDLPLILSEFGNWGLPDANRLNEKGSEPWWFETGHEWGEGIVYPHGVQKRYRDHGLDKTFGAYEEFVRQSQVHMAKSLHYEISTMRLHHPVGGYIITEFTDVHWECNGLLTMQREVKAGLAEYLVPVNQDRVAVIRPNRWSGAPGETLSVEVRSSGLNGALTTGELHWSCGEQSGHFGPEGGTVDVALTAAGLHTFRARWQEAGGDASPENQVELACVAPAVPARPVSVVDDAELAAALRGLGYQVVEEEESGSTGALLIARRYTAALQHAVQQGAHLLLLVDTNSTTGDGAVHLPFAYVAPREGTPWQGDWATSFSWLRKEGPFATLPGTPLLEMEYLPVAPDAVLVVNSLWAASSHSWANLALGWIHRPVSLLAEMPYGKGHVTMTTFSLPAHVVASDVVAQALLAGMVQL